MEISDRIKDISAYGVILPIRQHPNVGTNTCDNTNFKLVNYFQRHLQKLLNIYLNRLQVHIQGHISTIVSYSPNLTTANETW